MTNTNKVVAIMNNKGLYLTEVKTDRFQLKFEISYVDDSTKAITVPLRAYEQIKSIKEDVSRLAGIACGRIVVLHQEENVYDLDGKIINAKSLRDNENVDEMAKEALENSLEDFLSELLFNIDKEDELEEEGSKYHAHTEDDKVIWKVIYPFGPVFRAYELDVLDGEGVLRLDGDTPELTLDEVVGAMREHGHSIRKITTITKN